MDPHISVEENYYWEDLNTEWSSVKCYLIKNWYRISGTFGSKELRSQEKQSFSKDLLLTPIEDDCTGLQKLFYQRTEGALDNKSVQNNTGVPEGSKILFKRQAYETQETEDSLIPKPIRLFKEIEYVIKEGIYVPLKSITYNGYSQENNYQTVEYDSNGNRTIKRWFNEFNLQTQFCLYKSSESSYLSEEYYGIRETDSINQNKYYLKLKILYQTTKSSDVTFDFYNKKLLSMTYYDEHGDITKEIKSNKMGSYQF